MARRKFRWQYALILAILLEAGMVEGWRLLPSTRDHVLLGQAALVLALLLAHYCLAKAAPRLQRAGERASLGCLRLSLLLPLGAALYRIFAHLGWLAPPPPLWFELATLGGMLLLAIGIQAWRDILPRPLAGRVTLLCDLLITLVSVVFLLGHSSLYPLLAPGNPVLFVRTTQWASLLSMLTLVPVLVLLLHATIPRYHLRSYLFSLAGLLLLLLGQCMMSLLTIRQALSITLYPIACWLLAYPCFGIAALWQAQHVPKQAAELQVSPARPLPPGQFLPVLFTAGIAGVGCRYILRPDTADPAQQRLLLFLLMLLLLLFLARYLAASIWQEQWTGTLQQRLSESERLVMTDPLTGLANKRACTQRLEEEIARAQRYNRPLGLIFSDIDFFKLINDVHGHAVGDLALCALGKSLQENVRNTDMVARLGGEEFVLILPETTLGQAAILANRLRKTIEEARLPLQHGTTLHMTISLGVSAFPETSHTADRLLHDADNAMTRAKEAGRNRVLLAKATEQFFVIEKAG